MINKKLTLGVMFLFIIFFYLLSHFVFIAHKIESSVQKLDKNASNTKNVHHFVLVAQELDNPYWRMIEKGASDAAKVYHMDMEYTGPLRNSMTEQMKLLDKAVAARVDGIIVQGLNDRAFTPLINKAVMKGIPVITIDTDAPTSRRLTYVGTDNYEAGMQLGYTVVRQTGGKGKIGIIIGSDTAESQQLRLHGFQSVVNQFPNMEIVDVLSSNISRIQAAQQAEDMLREHKDITTMVGMSALDAIGILQATRNIKRNGIQIFGFDNLPETLTAISQGSIQATVVQKPYTMGYNSVRLLNDVFIGKRLPREFFTETEITDKSNVNLR